jgi:uncharacterized membrane protein
MIRSDLEKFEERMLEVSKKPIKHLSAMLEASEKSIKKGIIPKKKDPKKTAEEKHKSSVEKLQEMQQELGEFYTKFLGENFEGKLSSVSGEIKSTLETLSEAISTLKVASKKVL